MPLQPELFLALPPLPGEYVASVGAIGLAMSGAIGWLARTKESAIDRERKDARELYEALVATTATSAAVAATMTALQESNKDSVATIKKQTEIIDALRSELRQTNDQLARQYNANQDAQRWGRTVITKFETQMETFANDHRHIREALERVESKVGAA